MEHMSSPWKDKEKSYYFSKKSYYFSKNKLGSIKIELYKQKEIVDNSTILAEGIGKVMITRKNGETTYMHSVLYVPSMKNNLLSLGQLLEKGFTMAM